MRVCVLPPTHRPAAAVCGHVAVDLEACRVVDGEHGVDAILSLTAGVQVTAVTGTRAWGEVESREDMR